MEYNLYMFGGYNPDAVREKIYNIYVGIDMADNVYILEG